MKIVLEGTAEQIENLKAVLEQKDSKLPKINTNYQVGNLWSIEDFKSKFECTDEQALEGLEEALTNPATMEQIWYAIEAVGEEYNLKRV